MSSVVPSAITAPQEIWREIFSYLDATSLAQVERVCKLWKKIAGEVWLALCSRKWSLITYPRDPSTSWMDYHQRSNIRIGSFSIKVIPTGSQKKRILIKEKLFLGSKNNTISIRDHMGTPQQTLKRQNDPVTALCFNKNALFSGSDCTICKWDIQTNDFKTWEGHRGRVTALEAFAHKLFSGSNDHTIGVWDQETGNYLQTLEGHEGPVTSLCISGSELFSGSTDKTIRSWDIQTGVPRLKLKGHKKEVTALCPSKGLLFSASNDASIRIWKAETGDHVQTLFGHQFAVTALCVYAGMLFSGSKDCTIRVWDAKTGAPLQKLEGHEQPILSIDACKGKLYSSSKDSTIRIWDFTEIQDRKNIASQKRVGEFSYRKTSRNYTYPMESRKFLKEHKKGVKSF